MNNVTGAHFKNNLDPEIDGDSPETKVQKNCKGKRGGKDLLEVSAASMKAFTLTNDSKFLVEDDPNQ